MILFFEQRNPITVEGTSSIGAVLRQFVKLIIVNICIL